MEKKLSDYIAYYIGCKVQKDSDALDYPTIKGIEGDRVIISEYRYKTPNCAPVFTRPQIYHFVGFIKPILRRLEDIPDDEWSEIEYATSIMEDAKGLGLSKYAFLKGGDKDRYHWSITNELLIELRKRSVDVDGLIDAGLAIDAKTLTP